jgi:SAM-dependent methyltransferase
MTIVDPITKFQWDLARVSPVMGRAVKKIRIQEFEDWENSFSATLNSMLADEGLRQKAAEAYTRFAIELTRQQLQFERTGRYPTTSYQEVAEQVYQNNGFMSNYYLPAILLSHYLWSHHYSQQLYFRNCFLPMVRRVQAPVFFELGLGTGLYSRLALVECCAAVGKGFDISEKAVAFSQEHMSCFGVNDRWQGEVRDIVENPPVERFTHGICVEVLEHLEDPQQMLCRLRDLLHPGGKMFLVAAVTAAEFDHIYLYESADEVRSELTKVGLVTIDSRIFIAPGFDNCRYKPQLAAFIVGRDGG